MMSSSPRDNWERLVAAVVKRQQIRQLCHQDSIPTPSSSFRSDTSSHFSEEVLRVSSSGSKRISVSPPRQRAFTTDSGTEFRKNASRTITWNLFSVLRRRRKHKDNHLDDIPAVESPIFARNVRNSSVPSDISIPSYSAESLPTPRSKAEILSSPQVKEFSFTELKNATQNFQPDSFIGEGEFGYVFKGWIDHSLTAARPGSGLVIAVKKLKPEVFQSDNDKWLVTVYHDEWLREVNYLGQFCHPNLVKLIGYSSDGDNRLLVYEFMPKGSLENHLFRSGSQPLSWDTRIKVAIGAARGLTFLHEAEQQVIYRDFKASDILLDGEFNSKLSDFGLPEAGPPGYWTYVPTQVNGIHGCAAPGRLTPKNNVYSFGVVLLELLSGRCVVHKTKVGVEQMLVNWAIPYMNDKRELFHIMDIQLEGQYPQNAAFTAATIALQCLSPDPKLRPCMAEVLLKLEELQASQDATVGHSKADNQDDAYVAYETPFAYE